MSWTDEFVSDELRPPIAGRRVIKVASVDRPQAAQEQVPVAVELIDASTLEPEQIEWLWLGWLARGKIQIIAGRPGCAKTTAALAFGATLTRGGQWPDGSRAPKGRVVIWSGEDGKKDTIIPRLMGHGADRKAIRIVGSVCQNGKKRAFDPAGDVPSLCQAIEANGGCDLLIVDPLSMADNSKGYKDAETRRSLQPLVDLAEKIGCAVLGIMHFTKGTQGRDPLERVNGSGAFGALARLVMLASRQETDNEEEGEKKFALMRAKSNIGPDGGGFEYTLSQIPLREHKDITASTVVFGSAIKGSAREILAAAEQSEDGDRSALSEAAEWLEDFLASGPQPTKQIQIASRDAGHAWATIKRAKEKLGVVAEKSDLRGGWQWRRADADSIEVEL
jgi:putative DNA primase/helicase